MITLKGITWDHPRGYQGLEAATRAFMQLRPEIQVEWSRHSLHHFEFHSVAELAQHYDLMIIDHPSMGEVAHSHALVNLEDFGAELELAHLAHDLVGRTLDSYRYGGGLWALPIDAACQTAVVRADLLPQGTPLPRTWDEVRDLARSARSPRIGIAYKGVHALMVFCTLCANLGAPPFDEGESESIDLEAGMHALELMREVLAWCPAEVLEWNPIALLNAMQSRDDLVYSPLVFNYVTYSHTGTDTGSVSGAPLRFADIPGVTEANPRGSILGGTGYAIARRCPHREAAIALGAFLMQREVQKGMGLQGGQPARRSVWLDPLLNSTTLDFYRDTLATLEAAYLRPRHVGFLKFQWEGGQLLEGYLRSGGEARVVVNELNNAYQRMVQPLSA